MNSITNVSMKKIISIIVMITLVFSLIAIEPVHAETFTSSNDLYSVDISATTVKSGEKITFTANGYNLNATGSYYGEERYTPTSWDVIKGSNIISSSYYSNNEYLKNIYLPSGLYKLRVWHQKEVYTQSGSTGYWKYEIGSSNVITIPINVEKADISELKSFVNTKTTVIAGQEIDFTANTKSDIGVRYIPKIWEYENITYPTANDSDITGSINNSPYSGKCKTNFPGKGKLIVEFRQEVLIDSIWVDGDDYYVAFPLTIKPRPTNLVFVSGFDQSYIKDVKRTIYIGEPLGQLPKFKASGWKFLGLYTKSYAGKEITSNTIANRSIVDDNGNYDPGTIKYYAHWSKKVKVKFKSNSGKITGKISKKVTYDENKYKKYGKLPKATKAGYKFMGWYTKKKGGTKITSKSKVKNWENHTLYAHFKKKKPKNNGGNSGGYVWIIIW